LNDEYAPLTAKIAVSWKMKAGITVIAICPKILWNQPYFKVGTHEMYKPWFPVDIITDKDSDTTNNKPPANNSADFKIHAEGKVGTDITDSTAKKKPQLERQNACYGEDTFKDYNPELLTPLNDSNDISDSD